MVFGSVDDRGKVVRDFGAIEGGKQTLARLAEQMAKAPVIIERTFDAPAEMVWKAIAEREQMKQWYFDMEGFAPVVGTEFGFSVEHEGHRYVHLCKVTTVEPPRKLAYTWRYDGAEGDSLVTFDLIPEGDSTRLRLTHGGLHTFPKTPTYLRGNFVGGWTALIGTELRKFLTEAAVE